MKYQLTSHIVFHFNYEKTICYNISLIKTEKENSGYNYEATFLVFTHFIFKQIRGI